MSFGLGIGLQSQPPLYENIYLQRQKMAADEAAKKDAVDQKKREKDDENFQKYASSVAIDPSKYHNALIPEAKQVFSNGMAELDKVRREFPNDYMGKAHEIMNDVRAKYGQLQQESQKLWVELALTPGNPAQEKYQAALKTAKNRDDLKLAAMGDPSGSVQIDPKTGQTFIAHVNPKKDLTGDVRKIVEDQKNYIDTLVNQKAITPEFLETTKISVFPKNSEEARLLSDEVFKNTGKRIYFKSIQDAVAPIAESFDYQRQYTYDRPNDFYDYEKGEKKQDDSSAALSKKIYDLAYSMATPKVDVSIRNRPKDANAPKVTSGNSVQYGKVTASYSQDDNGTEYVDFQWTPTEAQNAKRIFSIGGKNVEGIPKRIIRDAGKAPELEIYVYDEDRRGKTEIITERVPYDKFSNEIKNQYGFNFATVLSDLDLLDKKPEERKGVIGSTTLNPVNPAGGATKTTVETQKPSGKKYTSAGIKAQAQKLGISEKQLKDKILLQFPDATFE